MQQLSSQPAGCQLLDGGTISVDNKMGVCLKKAKMRAGDLAQWVKALVELAEYQGLIPNIQVVASNHPLLPLRGCNALF